ncbi:MAG: hypothetical protein Q9202_005221 [Teloschistes flavicans]
MIQQAINNIQTTLVMTSIIVTPWRSQIDLLKVRSWLFSPRGYDGPDMRRKACNQIRAWKIRGDLPHAIESSWYLTEAILIDGLEVGISATAIQSCYCTALSRFVTGLLDTEQDGRYKQSMYDKAREIDLPSSLVELRHETIHGEMPSLVVLRQAAMKSFDWLKNDYWNYLPTEDGLTESDAAPFNNGRAALRTELKDTLKTYLSFGHKLRGASQDQDIDVFAHAATECTSKIVEVCNGSKRALLELVNMLVHHQMLFPGLDRNGRLANLSFPFWDPLFKRLSMRQSGFLQMLSYEMLKQLITTPDADPLVDKSEESVVMWLEHIYTAREWDKAFTHGDLDDLNLVSTCLQTPNQWTIRLAESIIKCPERVRARQMFGERVAKAVDVTPRGTVRASTTIGFFAQMTSLPVIPGHGGFVQPSSYLRPRGQSQPMSTPKPESAIDRDQRKALQRIRDFLKVRTSYDVLPLSFRLIIFDTSLLVKKSLTILIQNGIVSAPLWDSKTSTFAGLLTTSDYINLIQYYWQNPDKVNRIDQFKLNSLREIEKAIGVSPLETASIHPGKPLYEACRRMLETRARRIPLVDIDDETGRAMVVSVVTQYRILKFVAVNVHETQLLRKPLRHLNLGTYKNLETAKMETPVFDVIHQLVTNNISSVPILNSDGVVTNVFESVDVITLIKGANYDELNLNVGEALQKRSEEFPGIYTCSIEDRLDTIFDTIRKSRVHRLVVIDEDSRLVGVLTLSDILEYILLEGEGDDDAE